MRYLPLLLFTACVPATPPCTILRPVVVTIQQPDTTTLPLGTPKRCTVNTQKGVEPYPGC